MPHIRVLIADDHPVVRAGLQGMLASQADFEIVGEVSTDMEAVEKASHLHPNVVLMDLRMAELDGVSATTHIRAQHPKRRYWCLRRVVCCYSHGSSGESGAGSCGRDAAPPTKTLGSLG